MNTNRTITGEQAIEALNAIHAVLSLPYEWSPKTADDIAHIVINAGYTLPEEDVSIALADKHGGYEKVPLSELASYRPAKEI